MNILFFKNFCQIHMIHIFAVLKIKRQIYVSFNNYIILFIPYAYSIGPGSRTFWSFSGETCFSTGHIGLCFSVKSQETSAHGLRWWRECLGRLRSHREMSTVQEKCGKDTGLGSVSVAKVQGLLDRTQSPKRLKSLCNPHVV